MSVSLALLPSTPMLQNSSHRHHASPKRPKLSLNTLNVPSTFGKKSTSLRLDTLSATSPTARNTFSNATFNSQGIPGVQAQTASSGDFPTDAQHDRQPSPTDTATSNDSASSASTIESSLDGPPYCLSHNVTSILRNGPIPRPRPQKTSFAMSKRVMFPATKKVAFRTPLEEEVKTSRYTMRHVDIDSSTSTISTLELSPAKEEEVQPCDSATEEGQKPTKNAPVVSKKMVPASQTGDKRESSDEEDSDTPAATPIAGRRKRSRHWVWTLPQVPTASEIRAEANHERAEGTASA